MRTLSLPLTLLLAVAPAGDPGVKLPAEVHGPSGAFITVPADSTGPIVRWYALDPGLNLFPTALLKDTRVAVVTAAQPGRYRLLAWTAAGDQPSEAALCTVVIDGPVPPTPPPGPNPPPPTPGLKLWVIVVKDNQSMQPATAAVLSSAVLWKAVEAKGHRWRVFDDDSPAVAQKGYQRFVTEAGGPPALLLLGPDGKKLAAVKLPADEAGVLAEIRKITGD
jgi:hypothetical protein